MVCLLGPVHALGGEDADGDLLPEEVVYECARDRIIKLLFVGRVESMFFGAGPDQLAEGVLIDVVVHLAPDKCLVEVESLDTPPFLCATTSENLINHLLRFPPLLDERQDEPDDVGYHVPILQLLGFLRFFADINFWMVVFIFGNVFMLLRDFLKPRGLRCLVDLFHVISALLHQDGISKGLFAKDKVLFFLRSAGNGGEFGRGEEPLLSIGEQIVGIGEVKLNGGRGTMESCRWTITKYYIWN